jgi:hypothetical protein
MKAQIAEQLGYTKLKGGGLDENLSHEGNLHEDDLAARYGLTRRQDEVNLELLPSVIVQGHIDGVQDDTFGDDEHLIEIKTMGDSSYKVWLDKGWDSPGLIQKYKWQISVYMLATGLPCKLFVKNRNDGKIDSVVIYEPFYTKEEILARVLEMERYVRGDELPESCDVNNFPCPFYYLEEQLSLEVTEDDAIEELAIAYEEAAKEVRAAEAKKREMRKALDTGLVGRERVVTERVRVVYYEDKRDVIDKTKMKEAGIDVEEFTKQVISKRLRVTVKEDDERGTNTDESGGNGQGEGTDPGTVEESRQD